MVFLLKTINSLHIKFREIKTGKEFFVFNSHFDHEGQIARKNSSLMLIEKVKGIAGDYPLFATGDFNAMNNRIDYKLVTPDIKVLKYGVLNDMQYGHFPSDHFPVVIEAKF